MATDSKTTNPNQQTLADPTMSPPPAALPAQSTTSATPQTNERIQSAQSKINDLNAKKEQAEADFARKQELIAKMQQGLQSIADERSRLNAELDHAAHEKELAE